MTGELTLTGLVMPVGGIKEKTIAARRSGINLLILPAENQKDFDDLDESIKGGSKLIFVKNFKKSFRWLPLFFCQKKERFCQIVSTFKHN